MRARSKNPRIFAKFYDTVRGLCDLCYLLFILPYWISILPMYIFTAHVKRYIIRSRLEIHKTNMISPRGPHHRAANIPTGCLSRFRAACGSPSQPSKRCIQSPRKTWLPHPSLLRRETSQSPPCYLWIAQVAIFRPSGGYFHVALMLV